MPIEVIEAGSAFELMLTPVAGTTSETSSSSNVVHSVTAGQRGSLNAYTPEVANPGALTYATADGRVTQSFMVVSLPCAVSSGEAGYCRPVSAIEGVDGVTRDDVLCALGEYEPCEGLHVNGVSFACCEGAASELQKSAQYRREGELLGIDASQHGLAVMAAVMAGIAVALN